MHTHKQTHSPLPSHSFIYSLTCPLPPSINTSTRTLGYHHCCHCLLFVKKKRRNKQITMRETYCYTHTYAHTCIHIHIHAHTCTYTHTQTDMHTHTHTHCISTHTHPPILSLSPTNIHSVCQPIHTNIHTAYVHPLRQTYKHIQRHTGIHADTQTQTQPNTHTHILSYHTLLLSHTHLHTPLHHPCIV